MEILLVGDGVYLSKDGPWEPAIVLKELIDAAGVQVHASGEHLRASGLKEEGIVRGVATIQRTHKERIMMMMDRWSRVYSFWGGIRTEEAMDKKALKAEREKRTLTIVLTSGPCISDHADMAMNTALAARKLGYSDNVFPYLDGTWPTHIKVDWEFTNAGERLRWCIGKGVNVGQCDSRPAARELKEGDIFERSKITAVFTTLVNMLEGSDRGITFTG